MFERVETLVQLWHRDRNLIAGSTDEAQFTKLQEEVEELHVSIGKGTSPIDDIGDIMVVLINIAERNGLSLTECLEHAYDEIKFRRGKMMGGVFVKEDTHSVSPPLTDDERAFLEGFNAGVSKDRSEPSAYQRGVQAGILHNFGGNN